MLIDPDVLDFSSQLLLHSITGEVERSNEKDSIYLTS